MAAPALASLSRLALCSLALVLAGCGEPAPPPEPEPSPRAEDPELTHSWQMPADKSVLWSGDLGSKPPALADALMDKSAAPSLAMRIADGCARQSALGSTPGVALRLTVAEGGAITALEGDPAGSAATCLVDAARPELEKLGPLPAGAALLLLRFHAATPR